jgi:hypothetical protein
MVELPPASAFAGDDGSAAPALRALLVARAAGHADGYAVQQSLLTARVLTPVLAALDESEFDEDGRRREKTATMATVTVQGRDGRHATPVFTSLASMAGWNPAARPMPLTATAAARGAYEQGAVALLVDPADPWTTVLQGPAMLALAEGRRWLPAAEDDEVLSSVHDALSDLPGVTSLTVVASQEADLAITVHVSGDLEATRHLARLAADRLAACDLLRVRLSRGLDLAVAPSVR